MPSESAETLLVKAEGDRVLYLTRLRHAPHAPLTFSLPASTLSPSSQAIRGEFGIMELRDYRGVEVLAYTTPIAGTDWKLIAMVDRSEALRTVQRMGMITTTVSFFLFLVATALLWLWWKREQTSFNEKLAMEKALLAQRYDYLTKYANDAILLLNEEGLVLEVNDRAVEMYGYPREQLIGMNVYRLRAASAQASFASALEDIRNQSTCLYETIHQNQAGHDFPVEVSTRLIDHDGTKYIHAILRDISERRVAQNRIERLGQLNATLSRVNEAIVHLPDDAGAEDRLSQLLCQIVVDQGGMQMAWLGRNDPATGLIIPVAWHGAGTEYLRDIVISSRGDVPEGRGPTGTSLRENRAIFIENFPSDPATAPWHERALRFGWGASAALPVTRGGMPYAVLTLYHRDLNAFDAESKTLLTEVAGDMGYALDMLDVKAERKRIQQSLEIASMVVESSPVVLWRWLATDGWPTEFVSENVVQFGYSAQDFLSGKVAFADIIHHDDIARVAAEVKDCSERGIPQFSQQYRIHCWDGSLRWLDDRTNIIRDDQGKITHYQGITYDITERIEAETALRQSEERFRNIFESVSDAIFLHDVATGSILDVNRRAEELYGYTRQELLRLQVENLSSGTPPYTREHAAQHLQKALHGTQAAFEWHARHKSGRLFWVEVSIRPIRIADTEHLLVTVRDIDTRKQAELKLQLDAEVFRHSTEGIVITDASTVILTVNPAFSRISGYAEEEAIGNTPRLLKSERHEPSFY